MLIRDLTDTGHTVAVSHVPEGDRRLEELVGSASVESADVVVEEGAEIAVLKLGDLHDLMEQHPSVSTALYRNHSQMLAARLASANTQLRALD